jgi:hypothetical protein
MLTSGCDWQTKRLDEVLHLGSSVITELRFLKGESSSAVLEGFTSCPTGFEEVGRIGGTDKS